MDTSFEFEGLIEEPPAKAKKPRVGRWDAFLAEAIDALDKAGEFGAWASWKMADQKAAESAERAALKAEPAPGVLFETSIYQQLDAKNNVVQKLALRYINGVRTKRAKKAGTATPATEAS